MKSFLVFAGCLMLSVPPRAFAETNAPRRVFVLHAGLHTILSDPRPNHTTEVIRERLIEQGVPERDVILLDNPFPIASWKNMFPAETVNCFVDSTSPSSAFSHQVYLRLHQALAERAVRPTDRLIWIGHSAGGQVGVTMAHLGRHLERHAELARRTTPHRFDMVIALGAPLGANLLPDDVPLRVYASPQDRVVRFACDYGPSVLYCLGHSMRISDMLVSPGANRQVRVFQGVEHPCWDDERIVTSLLAEFDRRRRPEWQTAPLPLTMGPALAQLLCRGLDAECRISFEDPP
jgi:hypothetical protein